MAKKTVYVFGAGATRGCSFVDTESNPCLPPLDGDFFTQLQRVRSSKHQPLLKEVMKDVVTLFGNNFDVTMETVFTTLEHTIRMIKVTGDNRAFKKDELEERRERLLDAIHVLFEESMCERQGGQSTRKQCPCDFHERLVQEHLEPSDRIISFNYDCVLDYALRDKGDGKWNARYGYALPLGRGAGNLLDGHEHWSAANPPDKDKTIQLYKLHGSLHFVCSLKSQKVKSKLKQRPYTRQRGKPDFTIIPPEWNKSYDEGVFAKLWTEAATALHGATQLVLIGYSLPPSDLPANALFRTALRKKKLKGLIIVNPDREARKRIRTVLQLAMNQDSRVLSFNSLRDFAASSRDLYTW